MIWMLTFLWVADMEQLRVTGLGPNVSGYGSARFAPPVAMVRDDDRLFILDGAYQLWFISTEGQALAIAGGKGKAPGKFDPIFRNLTVQEGQVKLYHDSGRRIESFDRAGQLINSSINTGTLTYVDAKNNIELSGAHPRDVSSVTLTWRHGGNTEIIPLMAEDESDRCPWRYCQMARTGDFAIIYTTLSLKKTIYYAVLNLAEGEIWDLGKLEMADPRSYPAELQRAAETRQDFSLPTLAGVTASDELGFVMTENTVAGDYRILQIMDPKTRSRRTVKLTCGPMGDVAFAQHLSGKQWAGFRGPQLTFFTVDK